MEENEEYVLFMIIAMNYSNGECLEKSVIELCNRRQHNISYLAFINRINSVYIMMKFITCEMEGGMGIDIKLSKKTYQPTEKNAVNTEKNPEGRMKKIEEDFDELKGLLELGKMSKYSNMRLNSWASSSNSLGFRIVVSV